ncbi:MAG: glycosyltransferase WbuB [Bacteroidia bacterium]|nr:MAG: glycosyltransferase WbuB [Bacteroidia bacterium]
MQQDKKNIWIINEYAGSPYHGMEFRHYYLAKELIKLGYNVTIISASHSHLFKKLPKVKNTFTIQTIDGITYLWIKVPQYSSSYSKKRVLKWFVYTLSLFFLPVKKLSKPDYIIVSPMQTMPFYPAYRWAKKFKSKIIFEVKDIWPLSIQELGGYSSRHPFIKILKYFEKMAIQKSDAIVSVLPNYDQYLKEQGFEKDFYYIPNGVFLTEEENKEALPLQIEQHLPANKFIVGYTGTIGIANALNYLLEAAALLQNNDDIFFLIIGEGGEKNHLMKKYAYLNNVLFLPAIPKNQIPAMLEKIDVCYIGLENKNLFRYGVSPNKLFDYMLAEKPVVFSVFSPNNPVEKSQCGIVVAPANPVEIAEAVKYLYQLPEQERKKLGTKAKQYVMEHHTFPTFARQYQQIFAQMKK